MIYSCLSCHSVHDQLRVVLIQLPVIVVVVVVVSGLVVAGEYLCTKTSPNREIKNFKR